MPSIFEFQFNPSKLNEISQGKKDLSFESFCFEPKNIYEKKIGSLYAVGLLKNTLPQNVRFLEILTEKIKEKYYKSDLTLPEKSLRDSLKFANEHLEKIAKSGDVSWLGNLSFIVISLKDFELNFTKIGDFKFVLIRNGQIIDIDQKVTFEEIEPYPLKIFGNIVSTKLAENDIILILSQEAYQVFLEKNLLTEIAQKYNPDLFPKKLKNIFKTQKEHLTKISGICLLIVLNKEKSSKEKETLSQEKNLPTFNLKEVFSFLPETIKKLKNQISQKQKKEKSFFSSFKTKTQSKKLELPKTTVFIPKIPKIKLTGAKSIFSFNFLWRKRAILVFILISFLLLGFFIFEKREAKKIKSYQAEINQIQEIISQAEPYLDLAKDNLAAKENAVRLYKKAWQEASSLVKISPSLPKTINQQIFELENIILKNLYQLNNLVEISEPELVFEFKFREFVPQRLTYFKNEIYFFSAHSENILKITSEAKEETIQVNKKFNLAVPLSQSIVFFSKPNQLTIFKEGKFSETIFLKEPSFDFNLSSFCSYLSHLYFLDIENNSIIRYPFFSETNWGPAQSWLSTETINNNYQLKSITVDSSIWALTKENTVQRYYLGKLQESFSLDIFPFPRNLSKIFTSSEHSYLYILEPIEKRIIVLDKKGELIKQYQSKQFDNLLDFTVSKNDKTIWLLNGLRLYRIDL